MKLNYHHSTPNSSLDLNSSNGPNEQNDKVEVSPKKIRFRKKEKPPLEYKFESTKTIVMHWNQEK